MQALCCMRRGARAAPREHAAPHRSSRPSRSRSPVRNPFYGNAHKTVEPHLLSTFPDDFYGQQLRLVITGYMRPEANFPSLEALVAAIRADIAAAAAALDAPPHADLAHDASLAPAAPGAAAAVEG